MTVSFVNGTFKPDPSAGLALFGLLTTSVGGTGGAGGMNDYYGIDEKVAGAGGAGGSGGSVTLAASGAIAAITGGAQARSDGGAGGAGADLYNDIDFVPTTQGGAGGNGGTAARPPCGG